VAGVLQDGGDVENAGAERRKNLFLKFCFKRIKVY
jgi:hypothetical protein